MFLVMRMGQPLTQKEIEWAKAYIIWRSLLKALKKDQMTFKQTDLELKRIYSQFLLLARNRIESELSKLTSISIRVKRTNQPTVWDVKVGSHQGYIEINVIEIMGAFENLLFH